VLQVSLLDPLVPWLRRAVDWSVGCCIGTDNATYCQSHHHGHSRPGATSSVGRFETDTRSIDH